MNDHDKPKKTSFLRSMFLSVGAGYLAYFLWPGEFGAGEYQLAAIVLWLFSAFSAFQAFEKIRSWNFEFQKFLRSIGLDETRGSAAWMTESEARKLGLTLMKKGHRFMGVLGSSALWMWTETHSLIIGPAGSAKSSAIIMNILACLGESCLVNDTKGELYEQTAAMRAKKFGHRIVKLCATDKNSARINPLDFVNELIQENSAEALTLTRGMTLQLYPEPPTEGANKFFRDGTRMIIVALILAVVVACPLGKRTLTSVYRALTDEAFLNELLMRSGQSTLLKGEIAQLADDLHRMVFSEDGAAKTYEQFRIGAMQALEAYGPGNYLADITSETNFSFTELKTSDVTVYLTIDFANKDVLGKWAGLMQWLAAYQLVRVHNNKPVNFILDEFCNSPLHGLPTILTLLRSFGIKCIMATQDLDDITRTYGKHALETILSETDIKQFLGGIRSKTTLEYLSKYLGEFSERASNFSFGNEGIHESSSRFNRSLHTPDELRRLSTDYQIIIHGVLKPILTRKVQIFAIKPWREEIAPNSMYGNNRYLLPVEIIIGNLKARVTKRGRGINPKKPLLWPIIKYVFRNISAKSAFVITLAFVFSIWLVGFPHLRWKYQYSGSSSNPSAYYNCEYIGPEPFIVRGGGCPLIILRKIW